MSNLHSMLQLFGEAAENTGVTAPDAGVQGVKQEAEAAALPEQQDPEAEFDRLIRGQYKDQYNARVQDIVRKRLKDREQTLEQYQTPEASDSLPAKDPKAQYEQWLWQAQQARKAYPNMDIRREVQNPRFMSLLHSGVDVGDAYFLTHRDEIIPAVMRRAAKEAEEKLANRVAANGARPSETAMSGRGTMVADQVSRMSKAQRQDIIRRVQRGEIIRF